MTEQMSEQQTEHTADRVGEPVDEPTPTVEEPPSQVADTALFALLILDGLLLGGFGLVFTPLYVNGVPVPMGIVLSVLVLPWLVRRAGEIDPRPALAAAPLIAWVGVIVLLGLWGPGGDTMLPGDLLSMLLLGGGIGAGLWALRGVMEGDYRRRAGG